VVECVRIPIGVLMTTRADSIGAVMLEGCRCRCGHEWLPRRKGEKPRVCPKCKSPRWDVPKSYTMPHARVDHPIDSKAKGLPRDVSG
jgi:hypothetical protein